MPESRLQSRIWRWWQWSSCAILMSASWAAAGEGRTWEPAKPRLATPWTAAVTAETAHRDYPRPQMVRPEWVNLNGLWDYAISSKEVDRPVSWEGSILVPFPVESALSGVGKVVGPDQALWYRRRFPCPGGSAERRWLLHFGAVDWHARVWANDRLVGEHRGGYDPFTFDVTDALVPGGEQELLVQVQDPTDQGVQPRGKQVLRPGGIFYTAVSGIWQTVWLEPVPPTFIERLKLTPEVDRSELVLKVSVRGPLHGIAVRTRAYDGDRLVAGAMGAPGLDLRLAIPQARLWSPDSPQLYDMDVELVREGEVIDRVKSYFGLRKIEVRAAAGGINRLFLNGRPLFQLGVLDQGWWPDGLYTAPCDAALRSDLQTVRQLGFNMCRKHVKVEPARWYYWCDRLGVLVWQDMPNGDRHIGPEDPDLDRAPESEAIYRREWGSIIESLYNHPSVVVWVPFNEGWGQFKTDEILAWTRRLDPTRPVDSPSGWADRGSGDLRDMHSYPYPAMFPVESRRASVLGEFGGLGLPVEGHLWEAGKSWGYRAYSSPAELQSHYEELLSQLRPLIARGLAAAIYTQLTDVETEINGVMTYDRAVVKFDAERLAPLQRGLQAAPPVLETLVPTSEQQGQSWRYTTETPAAAWVQPGFDDSQWSKDLGGFGRQGTPGSVVRTPWLTSDIYVRRTFRMSADEVKNLWLCLHHDEDVEVYLNGKQIVSRTGYVTGYVNVQLDSGALAELRPGDNTLAVHCRQTDGGQYIDVGLFTLREP